MGEIIIKCENRETFSQISNYFIDYYMPKANGEFVKIYLYLVRLFSSNKPFSVSAMADILDCTDKDICRGLRYWISQDVIRFTYSDSENKKPENISGIVLLDLHIPANADKASEDDLFPSLIEADKKAASRKIVNMPVKESTDTSNGAAGSADSDASAGSNGSADSAASAVSTDSAGSAGSADSAAGGSAASADSAGSAGSTGSAASATGGSAYAASENTDLDAFGNSAQAASGSSQKSSAPSSIFSEGIDGVAFSGNKANSSVITHEIPAPDKPQFTPELLYYANENAIFADLKSQAEAYLGTNQLTYADINSLIYIIDNLKMPVDVIECLLEYIAVHKDKKNMRYVEKTAISMYKKGIRTRHDAEEYLSKNNPLYYKVYKNLGIDTTGRVPTKLELGFLSTWQKEYGFTDDIIIEACIRTNEKGINDHPLNYVDGILKKWHEADVRTLRDIEKQDSIHSQKVEEAKIAKEIASGKRSKSGNKQQTTFITHETDRYDEIEALLKRKVKES